MEKMPIGLPVMMICCQCPVTVSQILMFESLLLLDTIWSPQGE
jgi:hypothetical protein